MKRKWTIKGAIRELQKDNITIKNKIIIVKEGLKGLKKCSAYDFLTIHCGYTGLFKM